MKLKLRTYQAGSPRQAGEGLRIGPVRFLPRGIHKEDYARLDFFDVWYPTLAPSRPLLQWLRKRSDQGDSDDWRTFTTRYRNELLKNTDTRQALKLLAELAKRTPIAIGCYCADETRCHRSILLKLIQEVAGQ